VMPSSVVGINTASIFKVENKPNNFLFDPEDVASMLLWNNRKHLPSYLLSHPARQ
jgi:hypothetical protein